MQKAWSDILNKLGPPQNPAIPEADQRGTPPGTLWFRRPTPWSGGSIAPAPTAVTGQILAEKISLHHDATDHLPGVAQTETGGIEITAPGFDGSFLSLALGMTRAEVAELHNHDIFRLRMSLRVSQPLQTYARLTLLSGPNRDELPLELAEVENTHLVEWDLLFSNFDPMRAHDAWVDLIFENPADATISIEDLFMLRHPRANF